MDNDVSPSPFHSVSSVFTFTVLLATRQGNFHSHSDTVSGKAVPSRLPACSTAIKLAVKRSLSVYTPPLPLRLSFHSANSYLFDRTLLFE
ncbi:unnamed protein product [Linum trigynum]|uniref:Uncharacterized protein n=1 Tax=Linum trigynum TaxID=586398 RepID=A0AAV2DQD1_9ROSI